MKSISEMRFRVKERFFLGNSFYFPQKTKRRRESSESVSAWENSMLRKRKSPFSSSHRNDLCSHHFGRLQSRFTIKIKRIPFYVFLFAFNPISSTQWIFYQKKSFNCSFDSSSFDSYFRLFERYPVENAPWMSKARQSLTVLWSPIL